MKFLFTKLTLILLFLLGSIPFLNAQQSQYLEQIGETDSLYSDILKENRHFFIQYPIGYSPENSKKYPVAFILDGEIFLPTVHDVQNYYSGGFTPDMILVGISNQTNRVRDLTPSTITTKYGMPFNAESGGADLFLSFIEKELIPFIENKYPVTNYRTLIGHSYGGLFTIFSLLNRPDLFANYIAIDPSLDWDHQLLLKQAEKAFSNKDIYSNKAVFMSLNGQLHMQNAQITINNVMQDTTDFTIFARSNMAFRDILKKQQIENLKLDWKFYPKDIHGTIALPSIMDGLISLFDWYQMENTDKINSFDTPQKELLDIIRYRQQKLKKHFGYNEPPYPEELLNMSAYMNLEMQQTEKAKMYFELAIEFYPKSANAYDSMADYYESQGDIKSAITFVEKAYNLSGTSYHKNRLETLQSKN